MVAGTRLTITVRADRGKTVYRGRGPGKYGSSVPFREHPSLVTRLADGSFALLDDAADETCTVWFSLEPGAQGEPDWEGLLAVRVDADRARIAAVPLFANGIALGDVVMTVESDDRSLVATHVAERAGAATFRVMFGEPGLNAHLPGSELLGREPSAWPHWLALMRLLEPFEAWFDVQSPRFLGISVAAAAQDAVRAELARLEREDVLDYEFRPGSR